MGGMGMRTSGNIKRIGYAEGRERSNIVLRAINFACVPTPRPDLCDACCVVPLVEEGRQHPAEETTKKNSAIRHSPRKWMSSDKYLRAHVTKTC